MSDMSDMSSIDLEDLIPAEADEDLDAAAEAGLTGTEEESHDPIRDSLSELAAGTDDDEADDGAEEEPEDDEEDDPEDSEEELEDDPDDPEPEDEQDDELAQLKAQFENERTERQKLELKLQQQALQSQQQQPPPQQQSAAFDPVFMSAVNAFMGAGDPEKQKEILQGVPLHVREAAKARVMDVYKSEPYYAIDPSLRYRDQFQHLVAQQIAEAIKPYRTDRFQAQAKSVLDPYQEMLKDDGDRKAVFELVSDMPGEDMEKRVKYAVELHLARKNGKRVVKKSRQLADKGRDLKARKASRRSGSKRGKRGRKALPDMETFNTADYADKIRGMEIDPSEYEGLISG